MRGGGRARASARILNTTHLHPWMLWVVSVRAWLHALLLHQRLRLARLARLRLSLLLGRAVWPDIGERMRELLRLVLTVIQLLKVRLHIANHTRRCMCRRVCRRTRGRGACGVCGGVDDLVV